MFVCLWLVEATITVWLALMVLQDCFVVSGWTALTTPSYKQVMFAFPAVVENGLLQVANLRDVAPGTVVPCQPVVSEPQVFG